MAYSKQTWATGDTITAEKLNHMEDGIGSSDLFILTFTITAGNDGLEATCDKTFSELAAAIEEEKTILGYFTHFTGDEFTPFSQLSYDDTYGGEFTNYFLELPGDDGGLNVSITTIYFHTDDSCAVSIKEAQYSGTPA